MVATEDRELPVFGGHTQGGFPGPSIILAVVFSGRRAGEVGPGPGKTNGRDRLCRGGNRQANAAHYRAVIVRMRWHEPTIAYVTRRTAEGLSEREIIRCRKGYLARQIDTACHPSTPPALTAATPTKLRA
jgi:hypothetical protein